MAKTSPTLKLKRFIFPPGAFRGLPKREQYFFTRLALISDDIRHLHHLILQARVSIKAAKTNVESVLALHQLMFALRIYYGTMHEAWSVIDTGWHGTKLSRQLDPVLPTKAKESLRALRRYCESDSLAKKVRHNLAFHFPEEPIREALDCLTEDKDCEFVSGQDSANIFYTFAENVRNCAMLRKAGALDMTDVRTAVQKLYDECLRVSADFETFANAVMFAIATQLKAKAELFTPAVVTNFAKLTPVLFVDAQSMRHI